MASKFLLLAFLVSTFHFLGAESVGVCYGKVGDNLPVVTEVIEMYKSNGIGKMRIYSPHIPTIEALRGSGIELIVDVPGFQPLVDARAASDWVRRNILPYPDVKFRYISVGNEVTPDSNEAPYILAAMQNVQAAISAANLQSKIKVSTTIKFSLIANSYPPNNAVFSDEAKGFITPIVRFLAGNGSPLLVNIYPYFSVDGNRGTANPIDLNYALFRSEGHTMPDKTLYKSLFDAQLDSVYAALEKAGGRYVAVVVAETGWPSAGDVDATVENAGTYIGNLIRRLKSGNDTPKGRQGRVEAYLFAMFDENLKEARDGAPAAVEQSFGLFSPSKQPKYQINFAN